jgi:translation initiation factor IF-2
MAKVRVYELAKELKVDSKELVEKLVAGGMTIKNYMSTLDEEGVIRAKEVFSGVISEVVEEKRIKPTVIRRRRKKIRIEAEPLKEETEERLEEAFDVSSEQISREDVAPQALEPTADTVPETVEKEESVEEKTAESIEGEEIVETSVPPEEPSAEPAKIEPDEAIRARQKRTRKKRREEPAKIIQRPEEGPLKDLVVKESLQKTAEAEPVAEDIPEPAERAKDVEIEIEPEKEKKKKDKKKSEKLEAIPKKLIRHRRKEVFERADLYEGRAVKRKEKRGAKKGREAVKKQGRTEITVPRAIKRRIKVGELVTVAELAKAMGIKAAELIKKLLFLGVTANLNQSIDFETASLLADEFDYELELDVIEDSSLIAEPEDKPEDLQSRPPVVTIMGHVDHGKTSLLDYIRQSNIIGQESGGITQHIGAYFVETAGGDIVFLDTPGHEAFTAMRARGAKITDLIVLVVAADDGVMPQTREAINHARAANIPILVAVNKIDKPEANPDRVKRELAELDLVPEEWSGETIFGNISAKTGEGVSELLGLILLQAEMLELLGNPNKPARGTIIEARLDKSKGSVATVLIKNGTLRQGDFFVSGEHYGRVRAMLNQRGRKVKNAGPSVPVEIYGISGVPMAGDEFIVVSDEKTAKQVIELRKVKAKKHEIADRAIVSLDDLFDKIKQGEVKELNIVIKADVQGSLEALSESLGKQSTDEVKLRIIHAATGGITESDVMLAAASGAIIIGFNVRANPRVVEMAEKENVDIRYYDVIYNVVKDIRLAMAGLLKPIYREHVIGRVDIKELFHVPRVGAVAGCYVTDGHVERGANVRLLRDNVVVFDGRIGSLRRFKDDVKEVQSGYECGISVENFQDIKPGDVFEVYELEEKAAEL